MSELWLSNNNFFPEPTQFYAVFDAIRDHTATVVISLLSSLLGQYMPRIVIGLVPKRMDLTVLSPELSVGCELKILARCVRRFCLFGLRTIEIGIQGQRLYAFFDNSNEVLQLEETDRNGYLVSSIRCDLPVGDHTIFVADNPEGK